MKSPIYTILLSKSDFSFAFLLVTFELLDVEQSYIPLLETLMCGINAVGAQRSGCMFTLCHAPLKMAVLLHKMASVCKQALMTVCRYKKKGLLINNQRLYPEATVKSAQIGFVYSNFLCFQQIKSFGY